MKNRISLFVVGCLAGALGSWWLNPSQNQTTESLSGARIDSATTPRPAQNILPTQPNVVRGTAADAAAQLSTWQAAVADDAVGTLTDAARLRERAERRRAVLLVGQLWAGIDPEAALREASTLPPELVADYNASVSSEWANLDAQEFLNFAENASDLDALVAGLELLIATDPARVYEISGRLQSVSDSSIATLMHPVQRTAMHALADRDPVAAMRRIEALLPNIDQSVIVQEVITRFARNDPNAAWAWLNSLDGATDTHRRVILEGVAQVDFSRAFQFASTIPGLNSGVDRALARAALSDTTRIAEIASLLLNQESQFASRVLDQLVGTWAFREPDRLVDWMLANAGVLNVPLSRTIASQIAATDLMLALSLLERVPPRLNNVWVSEVSTAYASQEPAAALDWIQQYQGRTFYEDLHSRVIMGMINSDPELAASMIDQLSPALRSTAAPGIASALSERDPVAAANWAASLDDPAAASSAVSQVIRPWTQRDVGSARAWAMALDRGDVRDQALYGLIVGSYGTNLDPRPVLDEIDSSETLRMAQQSAMGSNVSNRPDLARELAEALLDDPDIGDYAREVLARLDGTGN